VSSGAPEGWTLPAPLVAHVVNIVKEDKQCNNNQTQQIEKIGIIYYDEQYYKSQKGMILVYLKYSSFGIKTTTCHSHYYRHLEGDKSVYQLTMLSLICV
jgi:hypothetical protein